MNRYIRRRSVKAYRSLSAGPVLPPWVKVIPFVGAGLLFLFVSMLLFREPSVEMVDGDILEADVARIISTIEAIDAGDLDSTIESTEPSSLSPPQTGPVDPPPIETDIDTVSPSPSPSPTPNIQEGVEPTITLQLRGGGAATVPEGALLLARTATLALFTGDFSQVPLAPSVETPLLPRTWSDPYVGDPVIDSLTDGVFSLTFRVDPDREGPSQVREITAHVAFEPNMGWVWLGV